jgi:uncharacterized protein YndB with AHSA1/START domain
MGENGFQTSVDIDAPPERVWAATIDIERWPEWTPTVTRARRLDSGPMGVGHHVRIDQPKLPPTVWVVEALEPERRMTLKSGVPGMRVIAHHRLEPKGEGCAVTLTIRFEGLFGGLLARWTRDLNRRYLAIEADGLKRYCENRGPAGP